ncbi:MAG: vitamin B12 dependent-methionine synthase activation domain-containing protein, partial [Rhodothermales bacterium]
GEMDRQGFTLPLLIGGATTSAKHTAVKIAPAYRHTTVHVLDASRSVGVVSRLISEQRETFAREVRAEYEALRTRHNERTSRKTYLSIGEARSNRYTCDWDQAPIEAPKELGVREMTDVSLEEIRPYIDWTPFFITWQLKGKYPGILDHDEVGEEARKLFDDAQAMLDRFVAEELVSARGVVGLWPANSVGDDIELYADASRRDVLATFHTLRQQAQKTPGHPNRALADFVAPKETGVDDFVGAFAVTAGHGVADLADAFDRDHDDYNKIMVKALADRLAEAYAELLHERVRREIWGYAPQEELDNEELVLERYRGIRPAPSYPACPDHTEKLILWDVLDAEAATGIQLTESMAMMPAASVCGLYFAHPDAAYFNVGKIGSDQVADYAARKGMRVRDVERWLATRLNYDPDPVGAEAA